MNNHILIILVPIMAVGLGLFYFFRTNAGAKVIDQFKPKPDLKNANNWTVGPILNDGTNESLNMPLHPSTVPTGMLIDMPTPQNQPHYITIDYGSLTGKSKITLTAKVEGGPFFAKDGVSQATICLYFQRIWDDWAATYQVDSSAMADQNQNTQYYRWYATTTGWTVLTPGTIQLTANLSDKWTALRAESLDSQTGEGATMFKEAIDSAGAVGFVLGGGDGWGHGVMSTGPSKITVTSFEIV